MKWTGVNELRESYLQFFESKNHLRHKSFPLVPQGDKSILLINAGMTPLKKYFTGEEEPPRRRLKILSFETDLRRPRCNRRKQGNRISRQEFSPL